MRLEADRQFETEVFPAELAEIRARRQALGLGAPEAASAPSAGQALVGLALSGGGIRSASLSLGVLQALAAKGALAHVDYLSTVSGGGLIGSSLSTLLNSPAASPENARFPLGFEAGKSEKPAVRYLRNHSRYLAPGGLLDRIRLPAVVLRGIVDNFVLLLPLLLIAVQLTEIVYALVYGWAEGIVRAIPPAAAGLFVLVVLIQPVLYRIFPGGFTWKRRDRYEHFLSASLLLALVVLFLIPAFLLIDRAIDLRWEDVARSPLWRSGWLWVGMGLVVLLFAVAGKASQAAAKLTGKLLLFAIGLTGQGLVFALYLLLTLYQVDSPLLDPGLRQDLESERVTAGLARAFAEKDIELAVGEPIEARERAGVRSWVIMNDGERYTVSASRDERLRLVSLLLWDGLGDWFFTGLGVLALLYGVFLANQNITSPHGFFRDRLSRAFVFSVDGEGQTHPQDALRLSELNQRGTAAPYHLINTTLNLQGADHLDLGGRKADFFIFSRHHVGGPTTGYCATEAMERYDRHLNLATAMAISGAGLSPNMGTMTVKSLVFLISLLNLRLDYWLPHPARVRDPSPLRRLRLRASVGPLYLLRESLGMLDARGAYVNVSDGGHLENLAVYELLRRRCKWIVAVDAGEDPKMTFDSLVQLIRYARIDLGIEIQIDLQSLRPGPEGWSAAHWTLGRIDYGGGEAGYLIYLKSSMTGDEPEAVGEYKSQSPQFPQESSANQFFTESQLEAYRALGEHIAGTMLADEGKEWDEPPPWLRSKAARRGPGGPRQRP